MTWNAFHQRGDILRAVVAAADQRRDGLLPLDVPGARENFTDEVDLLGALSLKWHARLSGNLERALSAEPLDLESAVARAWRTTAEQMPGLRLVIDRSTDVPATDEMATAMSRARHAERVRLAQAAGLANDSSGLAARTGARIEEHARLGLVLEAPEAPEAPGATPTKAAERPAERPSDQSSDQSSDRASFVRRIKAVLAA